MLRMSKAGDWLFVGTQCDDFLFGDVSGVCGYSFGCFHTFGVETASDLSAAQYFALAEGLRHEYEEIAAQGIILQVDCPDLAMGRHTQFRELDLSGFRDKMALNIEALNRATANIAPEQLRMHMCWGNYPGPHHCDVPFRDIIDLVWKARPHAIQFEAANPRHAHEFAMFEDIKLPEGKVLIPGAIECQSNDIEHPELIAQRIARYAHLVGRDNVMAGADCGFSIHVGSGSVDRSVVWAKMAALPEGANIASKQFWG